MSRIPSLTPAVFGICILAILCVPAPAFPREWETVYNQHLYQGASATEATVYATWFGTAAFLLSDGETSLLIDPFVTRPGLMRVAFGGSITPDTGRIADWHKRLGAPQPDAVIVTHAHYDHSMDAPEFARLGNAVVAGSPSTLEIARGWGTPEDKLLAVEVSTPVTFGNFTVRFLPSRHGPALFGRIPYPGTVDAPLVPPAKAARYKLGIAYALVISHPAGTVVHHASAGTMPGMYDGISADLILLGLAGRDDTATYVQEVAAETGAARVAAIHFDNFFRTLDRSMGIIPFLDLPEFFETAQRTLPETQFVTLPLGIPIPLY